MIRRRISGPIYTAVVKLARDTKSSVGIETFSTFDRSTGSFAWRQFEDCWYLLDPQKQKENQFEIIVYLEVPKVAKNAVVRRQIERMLQEESLKKLAGITILHIERAILVVCPHQPEYGWEDVDEVRPESFNDIIIHN